jgi:hypothetical protein
MTEAEAKEFFEEFDKSNSQLVDTNDNTLYDVIVHDYYVTFEDANSYQINATFESLVKVGEKLYARGIDYRGEWVNLELVVEKPYNGDNVPNINYTPWHFKPTPEKIGQKISELHDLGEDIRNLEARIEKLHRYDPQRESLENKLKIHKLKREKLKTEIEMARLSFDLGTLPKTNKMSRSERNIKMRRELQMRREQEEEIKQLEKEYNKAREKYSKTKKGSKERKEMYDYVYSLMLQLQKVRNGRSFYV